MEKMDLTPFKNKKMALVLSGGVVKAATWHLGVALALQELGFSFRNNQQTIPNQLEIDTFVGSSAGALISVFLTAGFSPQEIIHATLGTKKVKLKNLTYKDLISFRTPIKRPPKSSFYQPFSDFPSILKHLLQPLANFSGLFSTTGIANYLKKNVISSDSFKDYVADLFIVATELDHSRKVIFSKYNYPHPEHDPLASYYGQINITDAAAASMSVPPLYSPYPIKNPNTKKIDYYIDGDIRDTLSTHVAMDNHCEIIISSWTHTPYHFHDEIGSLINYGVPAICVQAIYLMIQKKIINSRTQWTLAKDVIDTVNEYMLSQKFPNKHRKNLLSILERKLNFSANVRLIDIYPPHNNYEIFFSRFFSLNPQSFSEIIKMSYQQTIKIFRELII